MNNKNYGNIACHKIILKTIDDRSKHQHYWKLPNLKK